MAFIKIFVGCEVRSRIFNFIVNLLFFLISVLFWANKRWMTYEHLVHDDSKGPNIRFLREINSESVFTLLTLSIIHVLNYKFGGDVLVISTIVLGFKFWFCTYVKSKAIVSEFWDDICDSRELKGSFHDDVLTFNITVNNILIVQVLHSSDDLDGD